MKKVELLAPAGNMEALKAAIQAGCDAVYIGGKNFGARAFSKNFSDEEIIVAINYAHLYGVKVYITVNTLIYDNEVDEFIKYIEFIHKNNVDAIIIQDLGMLDLVRKTFPELEIHASTQMHIHNLDGVKLLEELGVKRIVLARETDIDTVKYIKNNAKAEIEIFIHGALCISYSGECLMSSLIGGRSGNRGACAGSCRLKYDVTDQFGHKLNKGDYPLSTKDLNSLEYIGDLIDSGIDSFKIEGRMKSKEYVYKVVSIYRKAIDNYYKYKKVIINDDDMLELKKIFNREYTKGFLNHAKNDDIINGFRPNHMGVVVGEIVDYHHKTAKIRLFDEITIGSGLRVIGKNDDIGINVNDFYINGKLAKVGHKGDIISIRVNDEVKMYDKVVITLDSSITNRINEEIAKEARKVIINGKFMAKLGNRLELIIDDGNNIVHGYGNMVTSANNKPTTKEEVIAKLNKLGDTVYKFNNLDVLIDPMVFIPLSEINELRRKAIDMLNNKRLYKTKFRREKYEITVPDFKKEQLRACYISDINKYESIKNKYDIIYTDKIISKTIKKLPKVIEKYSKYDSPVMIGEVGGLKKYKEVYTDVSLNVVNSYTVAFLHSLGVKRITLSYELNKEQIQELVKCYFDRYKKHPNLELIVSSYEEVMTSKYLINDEYENDNLFLRDRYGNKFKIIKKDNLTYIYNYKKRNMDDIDYYKIGINVLRDNIDY